MESLKADALEKAEDTSVLLGARAERSDDRTQRLARIPQLLMNALLASIALCVCGAAVYFLETRVLPGVMLITCGFGLGAMGMQLGMLAQFKGDRMNYAWRVISGGAVFFIGLATLRWTFARVPSSDFATLVAFDPMLFFILLFTVSFTFVASRLHLLMVSAGAIATWLVLSFGASATIPMAAWSAAGIFGLLGSLVLRLPFEMEKSSCATLEHFPLQQELLKPAPSAAAVVPVPEPVQRISRATNALAAALLAVEESAKENADDDHLPQHVIDEVVAARKQLDAAGSPSMKLKSAQDDWEKHAEREVKSRKEWSAVLWSATLDSRTRMEYLEKFVASPYLPDDLRKAAAAIRVARGCSMVRKAMRASNGVTGLPYDIILEEVGVTKADRKALNAALLPVPVPLAGEASHAVLSAVISLLLGVCVGLCIHLQPQVWVLQHANETFTNATSVPGCSNECAYSGDFQCDDSQINLTSIYGAPSMAEVQPTSANSVNLCAFGTDCLDCGPRDMSKVHVDVSSALETDSVDDVYHLMVVGDRHSARVAPLVSKQIGMLHCASLLLLLMLSTWRLHHLMAFLPLLLFAFSTIISSIVLTLVPAWASDLAVRLTTGCSIGLCVAHPQTLMPTRA